VRVKQLEFRIENNIGFLTIHSFAQTDIKRAGQNFEDFIRQTFGEIKMNGIQDLILDLRDNTGGSDQHAAFFTSYFFDKPFRYWDRIEVTEAIAKEMKGIALMLYYRKPIQKIVHGYGKRQSILTNSTFMKNRNRGIIILLERRTF